MPSSEKTTETPASQSSTTTRPTTTAAPLRVRPPTAPQFRTPDPSTPSSSDLIAGPSAIVSDPIPDGPTSTRSTDTEPDSAPVKLSKTSLGEVTRKAVLVASQYMHNMLAREPEEIAEDVWIATEREQKDIGDPFASVLSRHAGAAAIAPDIADLVVAGVSVLAYVANHAAKAWAIRRSRRKIRALDPLSTGDPA